MRNRYIFIPDGRATSLIYFSEAGCRSTAGDSTDKSYEFLRKVIHNMDVDFSKLENKDTYSDAITEYFTSNLIKNGDHVVLDKPVINEESSDDNLVYEEIEGTVAQLSLDEQCRYSG